MAEQVEDQGKTRWGTEHNLVITQSTKRLRIIRLTLRFEARVCEVVRLRFGLADLEFRFLSKLVA